MYICRIRARGLIARPTLQLHWGCVQTMPHTLHPAPAAAAPRQGFCATQLPLKLLPLLHFDSPAHRKKIQQQQLTFQECQGFGYQP